MRQIIVIGNRQEIYEFCPEDSEQDWEDRSNARVRRYQKWLRTRDTTQFLEKMPWY